MPKDCCKETWNKIPDDEPVFTIRGQDQLAERVIYFWIREALDAGVNPEKIAQAEEHLHDIQRFQKAHPERTKIPD
jgi:hypothetical protein